MIPALLCALLTPTVTHAGPDSPTLASAIQAGYAHSPELPVADAIRNQGLAVRRQAGSLLAADPSLMLRHESDSGTGSNGFRSWEGALEMPLWLPGQRHDRTRVADALLNEAETTGRIQKWRVAGEIRELLWSLRIGETDLDLAGRAVQSAMALEADVRKRVDAGELARTDLILVQAETLARKIDQTSAASNRGTLLARYRLITGLPVLPADIVEDSAGATEISDDHPALLNGLSAIQRARAELDRVRGEKRANPLLALGSKTERLESGLSYDPALIVQVNLPLGTSSHAAPRFTEAERRLTETQTAAASLKRDLEQELIRTRNEKQQTAQAVQLSEHQQHLAAEGLRLTQRAFELGESDLFTLLQARKHALAAERDLLIRRHEQGRALSRHNQALGVIPE